MAVLGRRQTLLNRRKGGRYETGLSSSGARPAAVWLSGTCDRLVLDVAGQADLAVLAAEAARLESPEGAVEADRRSVQRDRPGTQSADDVQGPVGIRGPDAAGEAVLEVVGDADGVVIVVVGDDDQDGPKISSCTMRMLLSTSANTVGSSAFTAPRIAWALRSGSPGSLPAYSANRASHRPTVCS